MAALSETKKKEGLRHNEAKWTPILLQAGWSMIPNVILERQQALELDPVDVNIILHLVRHWWYPGELPFPSKRTMADCMGVDPRTVQRHIAVMEKRGLIRRKKRSDKRQGQQTNCYDLGGLIRAALPLANEALETRKKRRRDEAERRTRKKPRFKLVPKG